MKWKPHHAKDNRITSTSSIKHLDNFKDLPIGRGVYILMDKNHHVKYVGKAGARRMVAEINDAINNRTKGRGATRVKALYIATENQAYAVETQLRHYYDPPNNLQ
ncbi:MAG: excinuclease UvrABC nuclease subunit [Parvicellaceae bacterium]|jgi:excinuclease UvrABC nuclease subunit